MVLRKRYSSRSIFRNRAITVSLNVLLVALIGVSQGGCGDTHAGQAAKRPACESQELAVDEKRMNYIKDSLQRLFQWEAYWTFNDDESKSSYNAKAGQPVSINVFNFKRGVVVFIPGLEYSVVKFRKYDDGNLSNPQLVSNGARLSSEGDELMAVAKALGDSEFLLITGQETYREPRRSPKPIPYPNMKSYIERNRDAIEYCQAQSAIDPLPLTAPAYDSMDERKQALLGNIVKESTELARTMFAKGDTVTIRVPNFNLNDDRIWVLMEVGKGEAYTVCLKIDVMNTDAPVAYMNTVEIRNNPKYGIRIGADEKIKHASVKVLRYEVP